MGSDTDLIGCPICSTLNQKHRKYCQNCLSRIDNADGLSVSEAQHIQDSIRQKRKRRRLATIGLGFVLVVLAATFLIRELLFPYSFANAPEGDLAVSVTEDTWPKRYRSISNNSRMEIDIGISEGKFSEIYRSSGTLSAPVFNRGNIYVSSESGYVLAIDQVSYEKKWLYENGGPIDSSPLIAGNQAFWGLRDGSVISVNSETGAEIWVHKSEGYKTYPLSVHSGILFAPSGDRKLYALDALNGDVLWEYDAADIIVGGVALVNDVVVFNTATGFVNVLDLKSGRRKIFVKVAGLSGSPTVINGRVIVADNKGFVYEINPNNRAYPFEKAIRWVMLQLWAWGVRGPLDPPRGLERVAYFKDSNFSSSISSDNQDVFVLSVPLHKCSINSYIARNNPRTALDRACAFGSLGRLHSINRTDMELNWTYQTERSRKGSFFREPPLIFNNIAIIGDGSGLLHIIDLETGDHLAEYDLLSSISEPPVYSDGHVYIVTDNGVLHALPVEASLGLSRR